MYFMQLFFSNPNRPNLCPIFKWSSAHFDLVAELPCENAVRMELFVIESDLYIALANHKDKFGNRNGEEFSIWFIETLILFILQVNLPHPPLYTNSALSTKDFYCINKFERMPLSMCNISESTRRIFQSLPIRSKKQKIL